MKLTRLALYCQPSDTFRLTSLAGILKKNREYNGNFDISAVMAMTQTHFMYVMEGPREAVSHAFSNIMWDTNFRNVVLFGMEEIDQRMYDAGPVDFISADAFSVEFCRETLKMPRILPSLLSFENAKRLLLKASEKRDILAKSQQLIDDCAREDYFEIAV
ncbi:BLUF domain-containing protein [Hwanghaeella sp.]|uniref:BLUF domain-containing protein n=1 Tax=Hwanghaeella sp. TaxID=2605943 RepID=UPI003CCB89C2